MGSGTLWKRIGCIVSDYSQYDEKEVFETGLEV